MKIVDNNFTRFAELICPWVGTGDDDTETQRLGRVDIKNDNAVRALIERDIIPWFKGRSSSRRAYALEGLQYALGAPAREVESMLDSCLVGFDYDTDDAKRIVCLIRDVFQYHQIHIQFD